MSQKTESDKENTEDHLAEARGRSGFVHNRSGGAPLPGQSGEGLGRNSLLGIVVLLVAATAVTTAFVLGSGPPSGDAPPEGVRQATRPAGVLRLTVFVREGGSESELNSSDAVAEGVQLVPHLMASEPGWLLLAHVDPKGVIRTIFPTGTGGRASSPGKDKATRVAPLESSRLDPGQHSLYLVQGDAVFDTEGWRARPGGIQVTPPGLRVVSFTFERR